MNFRLSSVLATLLLCLFGVNSAHAGSGITVFDVPGSKGTNPSSINDSGLIVGSYFDANFVSHGFLRHIGGAIETLDGPGTGNLIVGADAINNSGVVAGNYQDSAHENHGYVRDAAVHYTQFDITGACTLRPGGINSIGQISGYWGDCGVGGGGYHGFLRDVDGTITTFDFGTLNDTFGCAINDSGQIVGLFAQAGSALTATFIRNLDGSVVFYSAPNAISPGGTSGCSINNSGTVAGTITQTGDPYGIGFIRDAGGNVTDINFGSLNEVRYQVAINNAGVVTGTHQTATDNVYHGFVRDTAGVITSFDVAQAGTTGGQGTLPIAINSKGRITGSYIGSKNISHGFVRQ